MAAVLGIMNYLPKLYAYGDTAPGQVSQSIAESKQQVAKQGDVAFTGLVSKLGKKVGNLSDATLAEGEFRGINFSNTIMSGIYFVIIILILAVAAITYKIKLVLKYFLVMQRYQKKIKKTNF
jgi:hypothetical protein